MKRYNENGRVYVKCEYSPDFVARAKQIHGKWTGESWAFDESDESIVKSVLDQIYGENGDPVDRVDLIVDAGKMPEDGDSIRIGGYTVCSRRYRDSAVKMGEKAVLLSGEFCSSGGSVKNPRVSANYDTIIRLKGIPVSLYERYKDAEWIISIESTDKTVEEKKNENTDAIAEIQHEIEKVTDAIAIAAADKRESEVTYLQGIRYGLIRALRAIKG